MVALARPNLCSVRGRVECICSSPVLDAISQDATGSQHPRTNADLSLGLLGVGGEERSASSAPAPWSRSILINTVIAAKAALIHSSSSGRSRGYGEHLCAQCYVVRFSIRDHFLSPALHEPTLALQDLSSTGPPCDPYWPSLTQAMRADIAAPQGLQFQCPSDPLQSPVLPGLGFYG